MPKSNFEPATTLMVRLHQDISRFQIAVDDRLT